MRPGIRRNLSWKHRKTLHPKHRTRLRILKSLLPKKTKKKHPGKRRRIPQMKNRTYPGILKRRMYLPVRKNRKKYRTLRVDIS